MAEFERAGVKRAAYLAEAHDPELHHPVEHADPAFRSEVAFIGKYGRDSHLHATRGALIPAVAARFDLKLYGSGWHELGLAAARDDVFPEQYREICRGAGIVLGCDWRHDVAWYFSNRTWFTLGSRGFLLTNYAPGLEEIFENHRHLVWYRSVDECLELIEHYRARPDERARIAAEGHAFARAHRTYDDFARDLVDLFEGREPRFPPRQPIRLSVAAVAARSVAASVADPHAARHVGRVEVQRGVAARAERDAAAVAAERGDRRERLGARGGEVAPGIAHARVDVAREAARG